MNGGVQVRVFETQDLLAGPIDAINVSILEQTGLPWVGKLKGVCLSSSTFPIRHRGQPAPLA